MKEEWLNRIAITWANRTRQRQLRGVLDRYASATEVIAHHPEMINSAAIEHAQKELDFIEKHRIQLYYYKEENYPYRLAQCADAPLLLYSKGNVEVNPLTMVTSGTSATKFSTNSLHQSFPRSLGARIPTTLTTRLGLTSTFPFEYKSNGASAH